MSAAAPRRRFRWGLLAFWLFWFSLPIVGVVYHLKAGVRLDQREQAAVVLREATAMYDEAMSDPDDIDRELLKKAAAKFAIAREMLPLEDTRQRARIHYAEARARFRTGDLVGGQELTESLLGQEIAKPDPDGPLVAALRHETGAEGYYIAIAMRKEGAAEDEWVPEAEKGRQQFRMLAEDALADTTTPAAQRDADVALFKRNLENVIRFEMMTDEELGIRRVPGEGEGDGNTSQRKRGQRASKGKGKGPAPDDARNEINKGASQAAKRGEGS